MSRTLYTIGYEGVRIEDFVLTLLNAGVELLVDVRDVPISRKRGFSKTILRETLEANGIRYVHLKGLGDPKPGREAARAGDTKLFKRIFNAHLKSVTAQLDLGVARALSQDARVCLMCFERQHCECHRSIVAEHVSHSTGSVINNLRVEPNSKHGRRIVLPNRLAA